MSGRALVVALIVWPFACGLLLALRWAARAAIRLFRTHTRRSTR